MFTKIKKVFKIGSVTLAAAIKIQYLTVNCKKKE
jgi:hypothetical protein